MTLRIYHKEDNSQISPETRQVIDTEVQRLVTEQYERAQALLKDHHEAHKILAQQLLKQEAVSGKCRERGPGEDKQERCQCSAALRSLASGGRLYGSRADDAAKAAWKKDMAKDGGKQ